MKKDFWFNATYTFSGRIRVAADSEEQAIEYARDSCGMVLGDKPHSSLPYDDFSWQFPIHGEQTIEELVLAEDQKET